MVIKHFSRIAAMAVLLSSIGLSRDHGGEDGNKPGGVIVDPKLPAHGQVPAKRQIPKGLRLVPVVDDFESISLLRVGPGYRVDVQVFIKADPNRGLSEPTCKTILRDIEVFAVNDVNSTESSEPLHKKVFLLVTPAQEKMVNRSSQFGSFRLLLGSEPDDGR